MANILSLDLDPATAEERAADWAIGRLRERGFVAYRVGGAVRDRLLGRMPHDVDVATAAVPAAIQSIFPHTYAVGEAFAVIVVHTPEGMDVEVATFRRESGYADGRHPEEVAFSDPPTDARRRDFTINALFYDPLARNVIDHVGGLSDLRRGLIRAIGDPAARFAEDHLRIPRAIRFAAALGFAIETQTGLAIRTVAETAARVSAERLFSELTRMLTGPRPGYALQLLRDLGVLSAVLPEVAAMAGVEQPPQFHPEGDVWQHTKLLVDGLRMADPTLAWSALLHDVGKPPTHEYREGRDRFPKHARQGAVMARAILRRFKASRRLIDEVDAVIDNHMSFMHVREMRPATRRRLLARPTFATELELHRLDCQASHAKLDLYWFLLDQLSELANQPELPPPLVGGRDLLALGLSPGPRIGELLRWVQDRQLAGELTDREQALTALRRQLRQPLR